MRGWTFPERTAGFSDDDTPKVLLSQNIAEFSDHLTPKIPRSKKIEGFLNG
jgi:hypothetical protein